MSEIHDTVPKQQPRTPASTPGAQNRHHDGNSANTGQTPKHQEPRHPQATHQPNPPHKAENPTNPQARSLLPKPNSMPNHTNRTTPAHRFPAPKKPKTPQTRTRRCETGGFTRSGSPAHDNVTTTNAHWDDTSVHAFQY